MQKTRGYHRKRIRERERGREGERGGGSQRERRGKAKKGEDGGPMVETRRNVDEVDGCMMQGAT